MRKMSKEKKLIWNGYINNAESTDKFIQMPDLTRFNAEVSDSAGDCQEGDVTGFFLKEADLQQQLPEEAIPAYVRVGKDSLAEKIKLFMERAGPPTSLLIQLQEEMAAVRQELRKVSERCSLRDLQRLSSQVLVFIDEMERNLIRIAFSGSLSAFRRRRIARISAVPRDLPQSQAFFSSPRCQKLQEIRSSESFQRLLTVERYVVVGWQITFRALIDALEGLRSQPMSYVSGAVFHDVENVIRQVGEYMSLSPY